MFLESRSHFGSSPYCSNTVWPQQAPNMSIVHPGGIGYIRLVTADGPTEIECRVLEALGDETIIAIAGNLDAVDSRRFLVNEEAVSALRVATATVCSRAPDGWSAPAWRAPNGLVRAYYRHVEQEGLSLSASEELPTAVPLAPAPLVAADRMSQLEETVRLLQGRQVSPPPPPPRGSVVYHSMSVGNDSPRLRRPVMPPSASAAPADVLAAVMKDPSMAALAPLLGGAAASGGFGKVSVNSDDSSEEGHAVVPPWGMPTSQPAALAPTSSNVPMNSTPQLNVPLHSAWEGRPPPPPAADPMQQIMHALSTNQGGSRDPLVSLMALQLMNSLGKKTGKTVDDDSDSSGLDTVGQGKDGRTSVQNLLGIRRLRRRVRKNPEKIIQSYEKKVKLEMGVVAGQAWTLRDYLATVPWGRFRATQRAAYMDAEVYLHLRQEPAPGLPLLRAAAQIIQNLKAKIQSVQDGGEYALAFKLTGIVDPLAPTPYAGEDGEMALIAAHAQAQSQLQKNLDQTRNKKKDKTAGKGDDNE